ncbi:hypothetical protein VDG1235_2995 [Verrucomicrobiia bacterium DG1235]|nr:hypothetical protein VDG1235_2995 [Verrucomicrobiae bacterium DG1235]
MAFVEFAKGFLGIEDSPAKKAEHEKKKTEFLGIAICLFKEDLGRFPSELKELCFNQKNEESWEGPYINWQGESTFENIDERKYVFKNRGDRYELESPGYEINKN